MDKPCVHLGKHYRVNLGMGGGTKWSPSYPHPTQANFTLKSFEALLSLP